MQSFLKSLFHSWKHNIRLRKIWSGLCSQ